MKNHSNTNLIFTIQLKLFGKIFDVNVFATDDKNTLIHRVCLQNHIPHKYYDKIQQKIMNSLNKLLISQSVPQSLYSKVQIFLAKEISIYETIKDNNLIQKSIIPQTLIFEAKVEDKPIILEKINQNQENSTNKKSIMNDLYSQDQKIPTYLQNNENNNSNNTSKRSKYRLQTKEVINTFDGIQQLRNLNNVSNKNRSDKNLKKKLNQNQNILLKAYKNVYTKCKNSQLKGKTKQYIEQIKYGSTINTIKPRQRKICTEQKSDTEEMVYRNQYTEKQNYGQDQYKEQSNLKYNKYFQFKHSSNRSSQYNLNIDNNVFNSTTNLNYQRSIIKKLNGPTSNQNQTINASNKMERLAKNINNIQFKSNKLKNISFIQTNKKTLNDKRLIGKIQKITNNASDYQQNRINTLNNDLKYPKRFHQKINSIPKICNKDNIEMQLLNNRQLLQRREEKHKLNVLKSLHNHKLKTRSKSLYSMTRKYNYLQQY